MVKSKRGRPREYDHSRIETAMRDLIAKENTRFPISDAKLAYLIEDQGVPCSKAMAWKRRFGLNIKNQYERKENGD